MSSLLCAGVYLLYPVSDMMQKESGANELKSTNPVVLIVTISFRFMFHNLTKQVHIFEDIIKYSIDLIYHCDVISIIVLYKLQTHIGFVYYNKRANPRQADKWRLSRLVTH